MARRFYYQSEVSHTGLNKYRVVKASSQRELEQKVSSLQSQWNEEWAKKCDAGKVRSERERIKNNLEKSIEMASKLTDEAERIQSKLDTILIDSLALKPINWNKHKDFSEYSWPKPEKLKPTTISPEPYRTASKYNVAPSFLCKLSKRKMEEHNQTLEDIYNKDLLIWESDKKDIEQQNILKNNTYSGKVEMWEENKSEYIEQQNLKNKEVDKQQQEYESGKADAIASLYEKKLTSIQSPFKYDQQIESEYYPDNKMYLVDFYLPIIEDLPKLKKVIYVKSKSDFTEYNQTDTFMNKKYDSVIYQMVLRALNYIFILDEPMNFIDSVVLNGKISTIDKSTGKNIEPYILSLEISKVEFKELNLNAIDPKAWFKSAKGISATKLANMTPIPPVLVMNKEDSRFIDGYEVASQMDNSTNLAAMDWQDFENLIREIFEKEFSTNNGEVKITQASRDGGVDAIAFDPDPIRGGKIVIQAKRYTNVVGVSAVRDLYGTTMNEGATKGILVTTSNYGSDAYNFAKGKPITLLNGANLLSLLEKHGHKARIDINEAKAMFKQEMM